MKGRKKIREGKCLEDLDKCLGEEINHEELAEDLKLLFMNENLVCEMIKSIWNNENYSNVQVIMALISIGSFRTLLRERSNKFEEKLIKLLNFLKKDENTD